MANRHLDLDPAAPEADPPAAAAPTAPAGTYTVEAVCDNCDWQGSLTLPKGTPAPRGQALSSVACPACGCTTVRRPAAVTAWRNTWGPAYDRDTGLRLLQEQMRQAQEQQAAALTAAELTAARRLAREQARARQAATETPAAFRMGTPVDPQVSSLASLSEACRQALLQESALDMASALQSGVKFTP